MEMESQSRPEKEERSEDNQEKKQEEKQEEKQKKKLLIATDCFLPRWDGIARFLNEIMPHLREDFDITVAAPDYKGMESDDGKNDGTKDEMGHGINDRTKDRIKDEMEAVKIERFRPRKIKFGDFSPAVAKRSRMKKLVDECDIVFSQTQGPIGARAILLAKKSRKPVVSFVHSIEWELFSKSIKYFRKAVGFFSVFYARFLYTRSDVVIVPFLELNEKLKKHGIRNVNTVVVNLGTDMERFSPPSDKEEAKRSIGIDPKNKVIGFTGRIAREKDIPTLLEAFRKINKSDPNTSLLVVGSGIQRHEYEMKKTSNVFTVGAKKNVVPYLQAMDIFVLPSLTETTSLATIEAMSCGIPVVVTPVGFLKSYVKENYNGLFFPFRNNVVLKLKLKKLLENPHFAENLGKNGRKTVEEKFSWKNTVKDLKLILNQF